MKKEIKIKNCKAVFKNTVSNEYEALVEYDIINGECCKVGRIKTSNDISKAKDNLKLLQNHNITNFSDISYIISRYSEVNGDKIQDIRTNAGDIVMTDNTNFLFVRSTVNHDDDALKVNFGSIDDPDIEEIDTPTLKPYVMLYGTHGTLTLYTLNKYFTLVA